MKSLKIYKLSKKCSMKKVVVLDLEDRKEIRKGAELLRAIYGDDCPKAVKDFITKLFQLV